MLLGRRVPCLPLPGKPRPPSPQSYFSSISPSSPLSSSCLWSQIISYGSGRFHWKSIRLCVYIHVLCVCVLSISIHHRRTGIMYAMYATRMRAGIAGNYIALALQLLRNFCFSVGSKPASYSRLQARVCECKKMERLLKPLPASHARHCLPPSPR